ncbi:MAG: DUF4296 domain-containing protein [Flavobacteriaceae bacterium]|nr:DUF4296 domain-containing protein [Flavobacteriaceae bacterium]
MKKILPLLLIIYLFSCAEKGPEKPKDLISKDKMATLLFDMHLANKTKNIKNLKDKKNINYLSIISEKHHIDSTRFKKSHAYYIYHISEYQEIYKKIESRLDTLLKKQKKMVKTADSLKKINTKKLTKKKKNSIKQKRKKPIFKKNKVQ